MRRKDVEPDQIPGVTLRRIMPAAVNVGRAKPITVEMLAPGAPRPRRRQEEPFVVLTHADAVSGFTALRVPVALLWVALLYRSWAEKTQTVRVPTKLLQSWGLNRWTRSRALAKIERAGLIRVERRRGASARVTLLKSVARSARVAR